MSRSWHLCRGFTIIGTFMMLIDLDFILDQISNNPMLLNLFYFFSGAIAVSLFYPIMTLIHNTIYIIFNLLILLVKGVFLFISKCLRFFSALLRSFRHHS